ncbi:hypothetical protein V7111_18335 [Neobacillus niacini]|uniref:hypothetical protein n=1 Tax=Neobacillus niacini TaxID=86668 RepID=UPI00300257B7
MQTVILAVGSMLVLMLIISFLPLGFTLKGKLIITAAGFVIALGGIAAAASFPLLLTFSILMVLAFFTAYIMDSRIGKLLYVNQETYLLDEVDFDGYDSFESSNKHKNEKILELDDLDELEETNSYINVEDASSTSTQTEDLHVKETISVIDDTEIAFLHDRDPVGVAVAEVTEDADDGLGYLSEIESLLLEEIVDQKQDLVENSWLEELDDMKQSKEQNSEENLLDDLELELFLAAKEVAPGREDKTEASNLKKKVLLEK